MQPPGSAEAVQHAEREAEQVVLVGQVVAVGRDVAVDVERRVAESVRGRRSRSLNVNVAVLQLGASGGDIRLTSVISRQSYGAAVLGDLRRVWPRVASDRPTTWLAADRAPVPVEVVEAVVLLVDHHDVLEPVERAMPGARRRRMPPARARGRASAARTAARG